ncbi:MAG TPA: bifunctional (p)ppGpp synthetase/guanosine-3',5'-bis(diphosphate) 3'-pyrophosphohydrolase [Candidatus Coproplasma excrementigallinarum]|uniref:GTP diphosphokinase n=1 Tax=Candidatus Coproplasma excrementigallinarum TaxID=2840747 RepID=A0A9D1MJC5_9FIRM|nr:bifunctional (p)ppGpp synthetase/guanosine-3',5'-bis(diphosphate) 3'-pyrophosphohydrolase [Candidatus Coproplasma excrementigallinarum]
MMKNVLDKIYENYPENEREMLLSAYKYAEQMHSNQKRASGEPYFTHPCAVAEILVDLGLDAPTVAAAFLHDVIEDTPATKDDIINRFGQEVYTLVDGVTKLEKIHYQTHEEEDIENFRKIFVAMANDVRVIIIKLADRLHNMRSLNFLSVERQQRIAKETLEIYTPLAGRLGISQMKCELEDLCLKYLDPKAYEYLVTNIHQKLEERRSFIETCVKDLKEMLDESGIKGEVFGRPKHFYSIYKKMKNTGKTLDQIYDLSAVRVIVNTTEECYEVLGKIHKKWKPVPGRIKDYIAMPKRNMYQSLHTTVVTDFGQIFEIQIRTFEMHHMAEYGIAAHWRYKEQKGGQDNNFDQRLAWIRDVMDWERSTGSAKEFVESLKTDLYTNELLVFTPHGKVISLPLEATPIDFAYAIHSEVGNKCVGAKVNSKIVPLNSVLHTGDVVEILTSPNSKGPSWDWLKYVKSGSARAKIRQFFKREMKEENARTGRAMLEAEAKRKGYSLNDLLTDDAFEKLSQKLVFASEDEMFASVGYGAVGVNQILYKLIDYYKKVVPKAPEAFPGKSGHAPTSSVTIRGMSGLMVRFARCCNPVPGDDIVGFVSRGRGVIVHRKDCPNLKDYEPDRIQPAQWTADTGSEFIVGVRVVADDYDGLVAFVTQELAAMRLSLTQIVGRLDKNRQAVVDINVRLNKRSDLDLLINHLKKDKRVIDVYRTSN